MNASPFTRAQRRKREAEDEHSQKRSRKDLPSASRPAAEFENECLDNGPQGSEPAAQLTKDNLKKLERETSSNTDSMTTKRASSRQASTSYVSSQRSSASNAFYRYHILENAGIVIHPGPSPEEVQSQLDIIYKRKICDERRRQISDIAKKKSQKFTRYLRGACGEDDMVELVHEAFREMYPDDVFYCPRKAGTVL